MQTQSSPIRQAACLLLFALLAACADTGAPPVPVDTPTDRAALCIQAVTTARKAATALLRADKISLEKDQQIQDSLNTAREGCAELAKGVTP